MKKRILGVKISTIIIALLCLIAAFGLWLFVNVGAIEDQPEDQQNQDGGECEQSFNYIDDCIEARYEL